MRSLFIVLALATSLGGCAGSNLHYTELLNSGNVTVDEIDPAAGTYRVAVMNTVDFGWDGGSRSDREKVVNHFFANKCSAIDIVSDNPLQLGTYTFTTKPRVKHSMVVRCTPKG